MALVVATTLYFLFALVCGFAFGAARTLFAEPHLGPVWATALELPLILAVLWFACGWATRRAGLAPHLGPRAAMGALWFALFLAAEVALGALMRGWAPAQTLAHLQTPQGMMGLAGFAIAALFPLLDAVRHLPGRANRAT